MDIAPVLQYGTTNTKMRKMTGITERCLLSLRSASLRFVGQAGKGSFISSCVLVSGSKRWSMKANGLRSLSDLHQSGEADFCLLGPRYLLFFFILE